MAWGAGAALPECRWARSSAGSGRGSGGCRTAVHHSLIVFGFFASGFPYFTPFKLRKQLSPLILHFRIKIRFQGFPVIRASRELWYRRPRSALAPRTGGGVWRRTRPLTHQTPAGRWLCSGPAEDTAVRSVSKPAPFSHLLCCFTAARNTKGEGQSVFQCCPREGSPWSGEWKSQTLTVIFDCNLFSVLSEKRYGPVD